VLSLKQPAAQAKRSNHCVFQKEKRKSSVASDSGQISIASLLQPSQATEQVVVAENLENVALMTDQNVVHISDPIMTDQNVVHISDPMQKMMDDFDLSAVLVSPTTINCISAACLVLISHPNKSPYMMAYHMMMICKHEPLLILPFSSLKVYRV